MELEITMSNIGHNSYGPQIQACDDLHAQKYRLPNESFNEACARQAGAMSDDDEHRSAFKKILLNQRYMPATYVLVMTASLVWIVPLVALFHLWLSLIAYVTR